MEQLDILIFDAIIKLRNNKKQPNENSIHAWRSKNYKSLNKKQLEERLMTLAKENKVLNRPSGVSLLLLMKAPMISNGLLTIQSVK